MTNSGLAALLEECAVYTPPKMLARIRAAVAELRAPAPKPEVVATTMDGSQYPPPGLNHAIDAVVSAGDISKAIERECLECDDCKTSDAPKKGYVKLTAHYGYVKPCKKHA